MMKLCIGEKLRQLRLAKGLTQEQVAEVFGVSAQAVSRWENNTVCPDVTLLPGVAMFYDTTVDAILGMDEIRDRARLREIHTKALQCVSGNQMAQAAAILRDALKIYPNDGGLLLALGETLAHMDDSPMATLEAITVVERALKYGNLNMKTQSTAVVNLIFLHMRSGNPEKANALIKSLPHIWESREMLMPEGYDEEYRDHLKKAVMKAIVFLNQKIDALHRRQVGKTPEYLQLGVDFTPHKPVNEMMGVIASFLNED